jgi:hypothetical protein
MGWPCEAEFQELLARCTRKASKGLLDELAGLAVGDDKQVRLASCGRRCLLLAQPYMIPSGRRARLCAASGDCRPSGMRGTA